MTEKKREKLNAKLCPEEFEICVPLDCRLLGPWPTPGQWTDYLKELTGLDELPAKYKSCPPTCWSCDCRLGWKLTGEWALLHARRVHDKIHRQALGLEMVTAVDVGFAISERQERFWNFLSIRVHVNKKVPPEELLRAGLRSLTEKEFALGPRFLDPGEFHRGIGGGPIAHLQPPKNGGLQLARSHPCEGLETSDVVPNPCSAAPHLTCPHPERKEQLRDLLSRKTDRLGLKTLAALDGRYPITGVRIEDLSVFCPKSIAETQTLEDVRLCICGVPIDIINASYSPTVTHPGGDADSGVFADAPKGSNDLNNDEAALIGRGRVNPMVGGISVGTVTGQAGTLGAIVWDRTDGTACGLSNWHVLAGTPTAQVGQVTYQPALFDGGTRADVIGHLKRWHLGDVGDAALTELEGSRHYASGEILGLWHPLSGCLEPELGMEVRKWGRTTGYTRGFVDGVYLATNIDYGSDVVRYFKDQFHIAPLFTGDDVSQPGDSGSLVVTQLKPIEQQRQLKVLTRWIRQLCFGKGYTWLCEEAEGFLEKWNKEIEDGVWGDDCPALKSFLTEMKKTVHKFCTSLPLPPPIPLENCCCSPDRSSTVSEQDQEGKGKCPCCDAIKAVLLKEKQNEEEQQKNAQCPCCYLKNMAQRLRELLNRNLERECREGTLGETGGDEEESVLMVIKRCLSNFCCFTLGRERRVCLLEVYKEKRDSGSVDDLSLAERSEQVHAWESRVEVLLAKFSEGCVIPCETVNEVIEAAKNDPLIDYSCDKKKCENFVECEQALRELLDWIVCKRRRVVLCVDLGLRVLDKIEEWQEKCLLILSAHAEAEKICAALEECDETQCESVSELVTCLEKKVIKKGPQGGNSGKSQWLGGFLPNQGAGAKFKEDHEKLLTETLDLGDGDVDFDQDWFKQLLLKNLRSDDVLKELFKAGKKLQEKAHDDKRRNTNCALYAVGMIFAGDTPGSPFGEFAVASDIQRLADTLRFSLRPVFEPRSSFRELRVRPQRPSRGRRRGGVRGLTPGAGSSDPRGGGPQPDPEPRQAGPGDQVDGGDDD